MNKFNTGDVVKYIKKNNTFWKPGEIHIIHEVDYLGAGEFQYSTNLGAWFNNTDFQLIRKADRRSLAQLDKDLGEEYEE